MEKSSLLGDLTEQGVFLLTVMDNHIQTITGTVNESLRNLNQWDASVWRTVNVIHHLSCPSLVFVLLLRRAILDL